MPAAMIAAVHHTRHVGRNERGSWVDDNAKPDPKSRRHADAAGDAFMSAGSGVSGFISDTIEPETISLAGSPPSIAIASRCLA